MRIKTAILMVLVLAVLSFSGALAITGREYRVVNCNEYITLRTYPDTKEEEIDRVPLGDTVIALGEAENGFYCVSYRGQRGYVLSRYLFELAKPKVNMVTVTNTERYNVNLFLSNFTEQFFALNAGGAFDIYTAEDQDLVSFGVNHAWFNYKGYLEWGEWGECNIRIHEKHIPDFVHKFFGDYFTPEDMAFAEYKSPYIYWTETGGNITGGFACLKTCDYLGYNRYRVEYDVYACGEDWKMADCAMTVMQARAKYGEAMRKGCAVIYAPSLSERSRFKLESIVEECH
ncbi:MAG: SH3 domain-containing protein [Clostridia bacterium]|nr:SH3 domain-containing protein [Clostridia bacterium]MBQ4159152.1 SH3 domain-containing protein [Clostridia bacterium]